MTMRTEKKTILIVDDIPTNRKLLNVTLREEGFETVEAANGVEALLLLEATEIDLIISDILMPNMDGFRLCREVRGSERHKATPFIFYTNTYTAPSDRDLAQQLGADCFLIKPASATVLRETVEGLMRKPSSRSSPVSLQASEPDVMKNYSATLVRKLGERNAELAQRTAELHASETRLRTIIETEPDCVQVIARNGALLESNRACLAIFEADSCGAVCIKPISEFVAPEYHESVQACHEAGWRGERVEVEFEIIGNKGTRRWLETRTAPLRDPSGEITALLTITRDNTERKRLEQQYIQAQKMEVLGHLASGVAHDFNNILSVVMGYSEMVLNDLSSGSPMHAYVEAIFQAGERAAGLTKQLLIFSRKQTLQPQVLDLSEVITGFDGMLRRLIGDNIKLVTLPEPELGRIKADPGQIEQVLMNLTVNARDAMPNGGTITIETSNVTIADKDASEIPLDDYVMFSVADDGNGMSDDVKAKLFEAFFTTKPAGKGTGLGLATSQTIVKHWGGHITVESTLGAGTRFRIYLPRVRESAIAMTRPGETGPLPRGVETILLVEDEPGLRDLAASILERQGYSVFKAGNGQEALRTARQRVDEPIDLVLTDMVMPEMGGKMMAEWLHAMNPDIKILFTSGYTDCGIVTDGEIESGIQFLPKPYTPSALVRKVREVIDGCLDNEMHTLPLTALADRNDFIPKL